MNSALEKSQYCSSRDGKRFIESRYSRLAGMLLLFFITSVVLVPEAEAVCGTPPVGTTITWEGCTETIENSNVTTIDVTYMGGILAGDIIIAVVVTDGNTTIAPVPAGWSLLSELHRGTAVTQHIFSRDAVGGETGDVTFTWTGGQEAFGYFANFRGATSTSGLAGATGNNPSIITYPSLGALDTDVVLRIAGIDSTDFGGTPGAGLIAGHSDIARVQTNTNANGSAAALSGMTTKSGDGATGTAVVDIPGGGNEQWVAVTMLLSATVPPSSCPSDQYTSDPGQLVLLDECVEVKNSTNLNAIVIPTPAATAVGDLLIAVITADAERSPLTAPVVDPTWDNLVNTDDGANAVSFAIFKKLAVLADLGSTTTFNLEGAEADHSYSYMLSLSGASGLVTISTATGNSLNPLAPAIVTAVDQTLVVQTNGNDQGDIVIDPSTAMIAGATNIGADQSDPAGTAVGSQGVYQNFPTATSNVSAASFLLDDGAEQWVSATLGVEPIEFRFVNLIDNSLSLCAIQEVEIRVVDSANNAIVDFEGTINLSTSGDAGGVGTWAEGTTADQAQGLLDNSVGGGTTNGQASYAFHTDDDGTVILEFTSDSIGGGANTLNYDLTYVLGSRTFSENTGFDPTLTLDNDCEFNIFNDGVGSTCRPGEETITVEIVDSQGQLAENYTGQIDLTVNSGDGTFATAGGQGVLSPLPDNTNDGDVDYTFDLLDGGTVDFEYTYTTTTAQSLNFDVVDVANSYATDTDTPLVNDADLVISDCEVRITMVDAMDEGDVCTTSQINIEVTDAAGAAILDFVGALTITATASTANWSGTGVANGAADDGVAIITFTGAESGTATLDLDGLTFTAAQAFTVAGTDGGNGAPIAHSSTVNETLNVLNCLVDIQVTDGDVEICRAGEDVTYQITDRNGADVTDFVGSIVLQNENPSLTGVGDYEVVDNGQSPELRFANFGNGVATYDFIALDNGLLTVTFTHDVAEVVNLNIAGGGLEEDTGTSVDDVTFNACEFLIEVADGASDVCSIELVTISLMESDGLTPVDDYVGTINLSTGFDNGTWALSTGGGSFSDPSANDGEASYTFVNGDDGVVILEFTDETAETVDIDVIDNASNTTEGATDEGIIVDLCTIEISYTDTNPGVSNACTFEIVQIRVVDSTLNDADDYEGTISLSTSTNNGNWEVQTGENAIVDTPFDDDGLATYTFGPTDDGIVIMEFENVNPETISLDAQDGLILVDGAADPNLSVQSCLPTASTPSCVQGTTTSITIPDAQNTNPLLQGRMVLMLIADESTVGDISANFDIDPTAGVNNVAMTYIGRSQNGTGNGNTTEIWAIPDLSMAAAADTYDASFTGTTNDPAMCLVYLTDVDQYVNFDIDGNSGTINDPVNSSTAGNVADVATTIKTTGNNAIVISLASHGGNGTYDDVDPSPPMTRLYDGPPNPGSAIMSISEGTNPSAAAITITESASNTPADGHSHIVASFAPIVSGDPLAEGYVPVTLFQTYSGNISYKAIGNTNRSTQGATCNFVAPTTGSAATLSLSVDPDTLTDKETFNSIVAAYLYWSGSGDIDDEFSPDILDNVKFGSDSLSSAALPGITADDVFIITEATVSFPGLDFFLGYKDVTATVAAELLASGDADSTFRFEFITNPVPTTTNSACVGGWAMVVVYGNKYEDLRVLNLFHGFQPFRYSSFTLVPRNFRMATRDDALNLPNGQITHISFEGDETGNISPEGLEMQDGPGLASFTELFHLLNPSQREFNSTITRPVFCYDTVLGTFQFINAVTVPTCIGGIAVPPATSQGYELDFPGADAAAPFGDGVGDLIGISYGVDIDTHYLQTELNPFSIAGAEAEEITTRYESDADLVLLASEVITVTNYPIADVEITKSALTILNAPTTEFDVAGTGKYEIIVTNNGSGAEDPLFASGQIIVSDILPDGMTLANVGDVSGNGWDCDPVGGLGEVDLGVVGVSPGAFTCLFDIVKDYTVANDASADDTDPEYQLTVGEQLPPLEVIVQVGDTADFPLLDNVAKNSARLIHVGYVGAVNPNPGDPAASSCPTPLTAGVSPPPYDILNPLTTCGRAPQFDNVNDLQGGTIDLNDLDDKTGNNNNVDSVTINIRGVEVDLSIDKFVSSVLEDGQDPGDGQYTFRVTNNGPDSTTTGFTITDTLPPRVIFESVVADPDWTCGALPGNLSCTYSGPNLAPLATKDLLLNVTEDGDAGEFVTNTAIVAPEAYNFDDDLSNNSDTDISEIIAAPVGSNEKFLLSVSTFNGTLNGTTDLANVTDFDDDDLVLYDPLLDTAILFFDNSALAEITANDINATHLLPNGHIVLSVRNSSSYDSGSPVVFEPSDLIVYDPILETSFLLFDGSAVFTDTINENIDAVYILDNDCELLAWPNNECEILFSTVDAADIDGTGMDRSDLVKFTPDLLGAGDGTITIELDGANASVFGGDDQLDALYKRVDENDPEDVVNIYALSVDDANSTVGVDAGYLPLNGTNLTRDDVVELDQETTQTVEQGSELLFRGNVPLGVFTDNDDLVTDPDLRLDALHVLEEGYLGHFAITQSQAGDTCSAGKITITKHLGLGHATDTNYFGSVLITTDSAGASENWSLDSGFGSLVNFGNGSARYTFEAADNGQVTLSLSVSVVTPDIDINVTNNVVSELSGEDPDFDFNDSITIVSFRDDFNTVAFDTNTGTAGWSTNWEEEDDDATAGTGNVKIDGTVLSLTTDSATDLAGDEPAIKRSANFNDFNRTEPVFLKYEYTYASLNSGTDIIVVEVSNDDITYVPAATYSLLSGTNASPTVESINLTTLPATAGLNYDTSLLYVRVRVDNGYVGTSEFFLDYMNLESGTTSCNIGVIHHYAITFDGPGISCLGSEVTIVGHNATHFESVPAGGEVMTLGTSTSEGSWVRIIQGFGTLTDLTGVQGAAANTDGSGTYEWSGTEDTITLRFNYTDIVPPANSEVVNVNLGGTHGEDLTPGLQVTHDSDLTVSRAGLRFFNETTQTAGIPIQIAGKTSDFYGTEDSIILQAIRTSDDDAAVCEALFPNGTAVNIEFGAECADPDTCGGETFNVNGVSVPVEDAAGGAGQSTFQSVPVTFTDQTTATGAVLSLEYSDAGMMSLSAQYDVPFDDDVNFPQTTEDYIVGSDDFIVRPFGFDISFVNDPDVATYRADTAAGTAFKPAGSTFVTTLLAKAFDANDDLVDMNGIPDADADLSDNVTTDNFGEQADADEDDVIVEHVLVEPATIGAADGVLSGGSGFTNFTGGVSDDISLSFDEVGIITLNARLVDTDSNGYLGTGLDPGPGIVGNVVNVGRFYPHHFLLSSAATAAVCTADTDFTYMGQSFVVSFMLEARNEGLSRTENYTDAFLKLTAADFELADVFHAVDDVDGGGDDIDYSDRLEAVALSFMAAFDSLVAMDANPGTGAISGSLVFIREDDNIGVDGAEDGPYTVRIGTDFQDSDDVPITLTNGTGNDIDDDDGTGEDLVALYRALSNPDPAFEIEFRYGRMLIDNAFGSEESDLEVILRVEYFDGSEFTLNTDDDCTVISDFAQGSALSIVPLSYFSPDGAINTLDDALGAEITVEQIAGVANMQLTDGQIFISEDEDGDDTNRPFRVTAPLIILPEVETPVGGALLVFDLSSGLLPAPLDYLKYDWRGGTDGGAEEDIFDEIPESIEGTGDLFDDNPRGMIEFGSYRGHDRVINWQEIYLAPGP